MVAWTSLCVIFLAVGAVVGNPASLLKLVNDERNKVGVDPLVLDARLIKAAQAHSEYQASINAITHDDPIGNLGDRIKKLGYIYENVGENIAFGFTTEASVMEAWMNSPQHRANILNPNFRHFGSGFTKNYWTQNFGNFLYGGEVAIPPASNSLPPLAFTPHLRTDRTGYEENYDSNLGIGFWRLCGLRRRVTILAISGEFETNRCFVLRIYIADRAVIIPEFRQDRTIRLRS
ncbi:1414_t:CDS:2 [Paraglomus occultum]|uniref:1414_t:CDS:1 n=1 Tax=Paraglomus occultum TaxID=144539 RepID=A0A9N9FUI8_9GLOM|nr:1414_t:CDS:2 [Paraglomus occultum]